MGNKKTLTDKDLVDAVANGDLESGWFLLMRHKLAIYRAIKCEVRKCGLYYSACVRRLYNYNDIFQSYLIQCYHEEFRFITKYDNETYETAAGLIFRHASFFVNKFLYSSRLRNEIDNVVKVYDISDLYEQPRYTSSVDDDFDKADAVKNIKKAISDTFDKTEAQAFEIITGYKFGMRPTPIVEKRMLLSELYGKYITSNNYYSIKKDLVKRFKESSQHLTNYI